MLTIRYSDGNVIAFTINDELWYLRMIPGPPAIYDSNLKRQIIPNVDKWFQAKTGHRYTYMTVCDMGTAFSTGLKCGYDLDDMVYACTDAVNLSVDLIFKTEMVLEYSNKFWIEIMNPVKITAFARKIRDNLDILRKKYGDDILFNYICRLWKLCNFVDPGSAAIFERLVEKLNLKVKDPEYPDTPNIELVESVIEKIISADAIKYKGVQPEIVRAIAHIKSK